MPRQTIRVGGRVRPVRIPTAAGSPPAAPGQPTGLVVNPINSSSIGLAWTMGGATATTVQVQRSTDNVTFAAVATQSSPLNSYTDTHLNSSTLYYYRVVASNGGGSSPPSAVNSATTGSGVVPGQPTSFAVIGIDASTAGLRWTLNGASSSSVTVERSPDGVTGWAAVAISGNGTATVTTNNAIDGGLSASAAYHYRVFASNANGDSPYSSVQSVSISATGSSPGQPTGLTATTIDDHSISLAWTLVGSPAASVRVERSPDGSSGWVAIADQPTLPFFGTSWTDPFLFASTLYYYRVVATNGFGASPSSAVASATTAALPTATVPAAPARLVAATNGPSSLALTWYPTQDGRSSVAVERSANGTTGWATLATLPAAAQVVPTAYVDEGLATGTTYHYRVTASNPAGTGTTSSAVAGTTAAAVTMSGRTLLGTQDITLLGAYFVADSAAPGSYFTRIFTHRYVGGQLRFLVGGQNNDIAEVAAPGSFGATATTRTNLWSGPDVWGNTIGQGGIWWEDQGGGTGRLWGTQGLDYPGGNEVAECQAVSVRNLGSSGSVTGYSGLWGFRGVSQRCVMWGVRKNPSWFQSLYGVGPYLYGTGGYSSLLTQGGNVSLGLFALASHDVTLDTPVAYGPPSTIGSDWTVDTSGFKILADHRSGSSGSDWYSGTLGPSYSYPPPFDQGRRLTPVKNFFNTAVGPPGFSNGAFRNQWVVDYFDTHFPEGLDPAAQWLSPAADGFARATWGDGYGGSLCWVDGASKYGLVCTASCSRDWGGYINSTIQSNAGAGEIHIYDPASLGAAAAGTLDPWNVQPYAMKDITPDLVAQGGCGQARGTIGNGTPAAASFDPATNRLYVFVPGLANGNNCGIFVYSVNA